MGKNDAAMKAGGKATWRKRHAEAKLRKLMAQAKDRPMTKEIVDQVLKIITEIEKDLAVERKEDQAIRQNFLYKMNMMKKLERYINYENEIARKKWKTIMEEEATAKKMFAEFRQFAALYRI